MSSGIYRIVNKQNGNEYIGQSRVISDRFTSHRTNLRNKCHGNSHLQNAWDKYGADAFRFEILEENIPDNELLAKEKEYIDDRKPEYNIMNNKYNQLLSVFVTMEDIDRYPIYEFGTHDKMRPAWHAWVYGSAVNPLLSGSRTRKTRG